MLDLLSNQELEQVMGGTSKEDYCDTLSMLIEHNWGSWSDGERSSAADAYSAHC
jgi:hypothetical protein